MKYGILICIHVILGEILQTQDLKPDCLETLLVVKKNGHSQNVWYCL